MAKYINNEALYNAFVAWQTARKTDKNAPIPEEIGTAALTIARKLATKSNFIAYTFIEDAIADAMLCVAKYARNFDPAKSKNCFSYLTQVCHNAFVRTIMAEKRVKAIEASAMLADDLQTYTTQPHDRSKYRNTYTEFRQEVEKTTELVEHYEAYRQKKKARTKAAKQAA